jgi:hypothetical protein
VQAAVLNILVYEFWVDEATGVRAFLPRPWAAELDAPLCLGRNLHAVVVDDSLS